MEASDNKRTSRKKSTQNALSVIGRRPPEARELEEAILGALMLEKDAYSVVSDILKPASFYVHAHELIYTAIQNLSITQKPVDMLTVQEQLRKQGDLEDAGGAYYLAELTGKVASTAHLEYHARIVQQKYLARELISYTSQIQGKAFDETIDVDDLMQEAEAGLFEISQHNMKKDVIQINPIIDEAFRLLNIAAKREDGLSGLATGFHDFIFTANNRIHTAFKSRFCHIKSEIVQRWRV